MSAPSAPVDEPSVEILAPEEWERFRVLRLSALQDTPEAFWATFDEERLRPEAFWRGWLGKMTALLTAIRTEEGRKQDAGLVVVGGSVDRPDVAGLYAMWVAPWARGRGVGDALLSAAVARAVAEGFDRMVLEVGDRNEPAIALYERFGFSPTGRRRAFPPPREHLTEHERALDL